MARVALARCPNLAMTARENSIERVSARLLNTGYEAREGAARGLGVCLLRERRLAVCDVSRCVASIPSVEPHVS